MRACANNDCSQLNPQPLGNFETGRATCRECRKAYMKLHRERNRGQYNAYMRDYNRRFPVDPAKESERQAKKYLKYKKQIDQRNEQWRQDYPHLVAAHTAKYRAAKWQRTPKWLSSEQLDNIQRFYTEAYRKTKDTGVEYEVDHIVPLRGKSVSGLHVPWNLQVIEKCGPNGNRSKQNKFKAS